MRRPLVVHAPQRPSLTGVRETALHDARIEAVRVELATAETTGEEAADIGVDVEIDVIGALEGRLSEDQRQALNWRPVWRSEGATNS